jgi:tRNA G10  N-methylase Trm11
MIKSVSENQNDILNAIKELHLNGKEYQCDITYGNGSFWKHINPPKLKFDITPLQKDVTKASSTNLPLSNNSLDNVVFDPPFITYVKKGRNHNSVMAKRFGGYYSYEELIEHYEGTIIETHRVLLKKGKLIFKCQDIVHNHSLKVTHANVIMLAEENGFKLVDMFVLIAKHRMPIRNKMNQNNWKQKHARIYHSYFLVFEKA